MPKTHFCANCNGKVPTTHGMKLHFARRPDCRKWFLSQVEKTAFTVWDEELDSNPPAVSPPLSHISSLDSGDNNPQVEADLTIGDNFVPSLKHPRSPTPDDVAPDHSKRARVEDAEDEDEPNLSRYTEAYPGRVADVLGSKPTKFEKIQAQQKSDGLEPWAPFADEEEWELVKWLMKNVGQTKTDEFLKLPIVSPLMVHPMTC